jgi:hypothetical protein
VWEEYASFELVEQGGYMFPAIPVIWPYRVPHSVCEYLYVKVIEVGLSYVDTCLLALYIGEAHREAMRLCRSSGGYSTVIFLFFGQVAGGRPGNCFRSLEVFYLKLSTI